MFDIRKEITTLRDGLDPRWNWRGLRMAENPVFPAENVLPEVCRDFMRNAGTVGGGTLVIYGGALNDLANGKSPKDYDGYCLTTYHPLFAVHRVARWAQKSGYEISYRRRRVRLLWKQLMVKTEHGDYDLTFLQGATPLPDFVRERADQADVSPCARAAATDMAFQSERCIRGEAREQLIFRPFSIDKDRFRHLDRWHKYAICKYPDREVVYQAEADAALFSELGALRGEIRKRHLELSAQGAPPQNFEPFRPLVPELYARLFERAQTQLTSI